MAVLKNILLTGEPGIGKSTVIQAVLSELPVTAMGFYTSEIRSGKTRKGFQLNTLSGENYILAHVNKRSTYKVGKYGVEVKLLDDVAAPLLEEALQKKASLIVIDEIGKMECFSKSFRDNALKCLDSDVPVLGTIQNFANPVINMIMNRNDVVLIEITVENRNLIVENIVNIIKCLLPQDKLSKKKKKKKKKKGKS